MSNSPNSFHKSPKENQETQAGRGGIFYGWWLVGVNLGDEAPQNNLEFLGRQLTPEQQAEAGKLAEKLEGEMADTQKKP